jgi:NAD(P)-dependent dehydrogenase (short-subunit alcohol dehydrogenase family)
MHTPQIAKCSCINLTFKHFHHESHFYKFSYANTFEMPALAWANSSLYASSKAALTSLGRIFATELAPRGIRVNTVSPGPISTPIYGRMGMEAKQLEGFAEQVRGQVPLKRFGDAQEIAKTVIFLASSDAAFITGQNLAVDGGIGL